MRVLQRQPWNAICSLRSYALALPLCTHVCDKATKSNEKRDALTPHEPPCVETSSGPRLLRFAHSYSQTIKLDERGPYDRQSQYCSLTFPVGDGAFVLHDVRKLRACSSLNLVFILDFNVRDLPSEHHADRTVKTQAIAFPVSTGSVKTAELSVSGKNAERGHCAISPSATHAREAAIPRYRQPDLLCRTGACRHFKTFICRLEHVPSKTSPHFIDQKCVIPICFCRHPWQNYSLHFVCSLYLGAFQNETALECKP